MADVDTSALPAAFIFAPTKEFSWGPIATYYPGNTYNCTPEPRHHALREKCVGWLAEGLIEITAVAGFKTTTITVPVTESEEN